MPLIAAKLEALGLVLPKAVRPPAGIVLPPDGVMRTQLLEVFVKRNGRWVIEAYHNVDTKPAQ